MHKTWKIDSNLVLLLRTLWITLIIIQLQAKFYQKECAKGWDSWFKKQTKTFVMHITLELCSTSTTTVLVQY